MAILFTVRIYLDNGLVMEYDLPTEKSAREHAAAIVKDGYRHHVEGELEYYPVHRVLKVKVRGPIDKPQHGSRVTSTE